jgi:hypothetical protein
MKKSKSTMKKQGQKTDAHTQEIKRYIGIYAHNCIKALDKLISEMEAMNKKRVSL